MLETLQDFSEKMVNLSSMSLRGKFVAIKYPRDRGIHLKLKCFENSCLSLHDRENGILTYSPTTLYSFGLWKIWLYDDPSSLAEGELVAAGSYKLERGIFTVFVTSIYARGIEPGTRVFTIIPKVSKRRRSVKKSPEFYAIPATS